MQQQQPGIVTHSRIRFLTDLQAFD